MVIAVTANSVIFSRKFPYEFNEFVRNNGQDNRRDDPENALYFRMRLPIIPCPLNGGACFMNEGICHSAFPTFPATE